MLQVEHLTIRGVEHKAEAKEGITSVCMRLLIVDNGIIL